MKKILTFLLILTSVAGFSQTSVVNGLQVKGLSGAPSGSTPGANWGIIWGDGSGNFRKGTLQSVIGSRIRSITVPNDSTLTIGTDSAIFSLKIRGGLTLSRQGYLDSLRTGQVLDSVVFRSKGPGMPLVYVSPTKDSLYGKTVVDSVIKWRTGSDSALRAYLANTGVTGQGYGDATHVAVFNVGVDGRINSASNVLITGVTGGGVVKKTINPRNVNYTLAQSDTATYITVSSSIQDTIKIPDDATISMAPPVTIDVYQMGSGKVFFQALNGSVSVGARFGRTKSGGQYSKVALNKISANTWIVSGDLDTASAASLTTNLGTLPPLTTVAGTPSSSDTFTVSGTGLTANALVTAPSGFEVSLDNTSFASTKTITVSGGGLAGQPVPVYVRIPSSASAGTPSGFVTVSSTGATTVNLSISGTVSAPGTSHFRAITIPAAGVPNTDQSNFPVLFQGTYSYLATLANGGKVQNASGFDITFSTDNAGASLLSWEIESWNPVTGAIAAWVKVPTVSHTTTTTIYLRYGSTTISTFQGGTAGGVWDANFTNVYHFNETLTGSGQTVHDYTSNLNNYTSHGTWSGTQQAAGKVGGALSFIEANADYLSGTSQSFTSGYTVEGWYFEPGSGTPTGGIWLTDNPEATLFGYDANGFFGLQGTNKTADNTIGAKGTWFYFVITRSGTNSQFFRNGTAQTLLTTVGVNMSFAAIGAGQSGTDLSDDMAADEIRVSNVVRSNDWISTCYNNQNSPSTFYSIGAEN